MLRLCSKRLLDSTVGGGKGGWVSMTDLVAHFHEQFVRGHDGDPWYGSSRHELLAGLTPRLRPRTRSQARTRSGRLLCT
jgi:hypothetical protein